MRETPFVTLTPRATSSKTSVVSPGLLPKVPVQREVMAGQNENEELGALKAMIEV